MQGAQQLSTVATRQQTQSMAVAAFPSQLYQIPMESESGGVH